MKEIHTQPWMISQFNSCSCPPLSRQSWLTSNPFLNQIYFDLLRKSLSLSQHKERLLSSVRSRGTRKMKTTSFLMILNLSSPWLPQRPIFSAPSLNDNLLAKELQGLRKMQVPQVPKNFDLKEKVKSQSPKRTQSVNQRTSQDQYLLSQHQTLSARRSQVQSHLLRTCWNQKDGYFELIW